MFQSLPDIAAKLARSRAASYDAISPSRWQVCIMIGRFASAAFALVLGLVQLTSGTAADDLTRAALLGSWSRYHPDDDNGSLRRGLIKHPVLSLSFEQAGWFTSSIFYPQVGLSRRETLEANGKYHLVGNSLRILRSRLSGGWLMNDPEDRNQTCTLAMADNQKSFTLADCAFAGTWTRGAGPYRAPVVPR